MIFYANVIPYATRKQNKKTNARKKQLCKEYMIYILSNNYIIKEKQTKKKKNPTKKMNNDICPLANDIVQVYFKCYLCVIANCFKKDSEENKRKRGKKKEENQLQKPKKTIKKCLNII